VLGSPATAAHAGMPNASHCQHSVKQCLHWDVGMTSSSGLGPADVITQHAATGGVSGWRIWTGRTGNVDMLLGSSFTRNIRRAQYQERRLTCPKLAP